MKQLEIKVRARNNLLVERREQLNLSQTAVAKMLSLAPSEYNGLETFRVKPVTALGHWTKTAKKVAAFYDVPIEELWPEELVALKNDTFRSHVDLADIAALPGGEAAYKLLPTPETRLNVREIKEAIENALAKLNWRDRKVLELHFGFNREKAAALDEIAEAINVSRERVRQLLYRALNKLHNNKQALELLHDARETLEEEGVQEAIYATT